MLHCGTEEPRRSLAFATLVTEKDEYSYLSIIDWHHQRPHYWLVHLLVPVFSMNFTNHKAFTSSKVLISPEVVAGIFWVPKSNLAIVRKTFGPLWEAQRITMPTPENQSQQLPYHFCDPIMIPLSPNARGCVEGFSAKDCADGELIRIPFAERWADLELMTLSFVSPIGFTIHLRGKVQLRFSFKLVVPLSKLGSIVHTSQLRLTSSLLSSFCFTFSYIYRFLLRKLFSAYDNHHGSPQNYYNCSSMSVFGSRKPLVSALSLMVTF